jgi:hypothetical protein
MPDAPNETSGAPKEISDAPKIMCPKENVGSSKEFQILQRNIT